MLVRSTDGMVDVVVDTGVEGGVVEVVDGPQDVDWGQGELVVVVMVELWSTTNPPSANSLADHSTCGFSEKATLNLEFAIL